MSSKRVVWRKNRQTERPFVVQTVKRPFTRTSADEEYGQTLGESRFNRMTGEMKIIRPTGSPTDYVVEEHELGHLLIYRFEEDFLNEESKRRIGDELEDEHGRAFWRYAGTYERDLLGEAVAETFAARRFGWQATNLGFDPAVGTPKIWAFVNMVAERYELDKRFKR